MLAGESKVTYKVYFRSMRSSNSVSWGGSDDMTKPPFWKLKRLIEMTAEEWESLCDGCGLCCLSKLQDRDTEEIVYTNSACLLLDLSTCRCQDYNRRCQRVEDCVKLSVENIHIFQWLPSTCAYRLIAKGLELPTWHPLIAKDPEAVHKAGVSVRNLAIHESLMDDADMDVIPSFAACDAMD